MRSNPKKYTTNAIQPQKYTTNAIQPQWIHHKCNTILKKYTTIVRVYRWSFCSSKTFCIYSLFETCWSDIYLAFVFGGGWLEEETGAFTPTNGHYWDPIATHHTTQVPSVSIFYFLLLYFLTYEFSICFFNMLFLHMLTPKWIWTPKEI